MTTPPDSSDLQFDSVVPRTDGAVTAATRACTLCQRAIDTEYFDVNGQTVCRGCSEQLSALASTPRDVGSLLRAAVAGAVAAVLGAALYFAVIAISGFEIGLVAIAIGYMVGYGVRLGTRGRGGRRFQVLALVLTYFAVGLAYSSLAIKELIDKRNGDTPAAVSTAQAGTAAQPEAPAEAAGDDDEPLTGAGFVVAVMQLLAFTFVLPVLVVAGSLPGGLISGAIIVFGMLQAWKMTAAPAVSVSGPYRVATTAAG